MLDGLQKFQPIHSRKLQIGQDKIDRTLPQQFEARLRVSRRQDREAVLAEIQLEQAPHLGLVFDDQNRWHESSVPNDLCTTK